MSFASKIVQERRLRFVGHVSRFVHNPASIQPLNKLLWLRSQGAICQSYHRRLPSGFMTSSLSISVSANYDGLPKNVIRPSLRNGIPVGVLLAGEHGKHRAHRVPNKLIRGLVLRSRFCFLKGHAYSTA